MPNSASISISIWSTSTKSLRNRQTWGAGWIGEAYGKERVAMAMTGPWTIGFLAGDYPEVLKNTGIVEMPHLY